MSKQLILVDHVKQVVESALKQTFTWQYTDKTGSTNSDLIELAVAPAIAITECQTAGRGQRNKQWVSAYAEDLLFSMALKLTVDKQLSLLSLRAGLSIKSTLEHLGFSDLSLKWPNDIFYKGKKVGGILIESVVHAQSVMAIIGVGLNINSTDNNTTDHAIALGHDLDRSAILSACLSDLYRHLYQQQEDMQQIIKQFNQAHAFHLQDICFLHEQTKVQGQCQGVNQQGELLIQSGDLCKAYASGSIQLN